MFDGCAPIPDYPPLGPPSLFECIMLAWIVVAMLSLLLPRRWFIALTKVALPFLPDRLEEK
jgi:hypothetical protein